MIKKLVILFFIFFLLAGCSNRRDALYYAKHPEELKVILLSCDATGSKEFSELQCMQAVNIYTKLSGLFSLMASDQQKFGKSIISDQIKLAGLQEKINNSEVVENRDKIKLLKEKCQDLKNNLELKLYFAGKAEGM